MRPIRAVRLRALSLALAVALATLALGAGCTESEDEAPAPGATTAPATLDADEGVPGVSDSRILFGQSAAFTGPAEGLGLGSRMLATQERATSRAEPHRQAAMPPAPPPANWNTRPDNTVPRRRPPALAI